MEREEIMREIAEISKKISEVERKLDNYFVSLHETNKENIETNSGGLVDIASVVSSQDEAITELANLVAGGK